MLSLFVRTIIVLVLFQCCLDMPAISRVLPKQYDSTWSLGDSIQVLQSTRLKMDSLVKMDPGTQQNIIYNVQRLRRGTNRTPDFYLLIGLAFILGVTRYFNPRYYALLIGAFRSGSGRQWREMLQAAALANLGMNVFFCAVAGAYLYYLSTGSSLYIMGLSRPMVFLVLIAAMMLIYAGKYAVIRFSSWVFRVENMAGEYLFNVFLINKIIGIVLLPFVVIIAFAGPECLHPMAILSGIIVLGLLSMRYLRSWSVFYTFFKGSRFHFFTYLCASEILPMAVLVKWLIHLLR